MIFTDPQVILFVADGERAAAFYAHFGFVETYRSSVEAPVKVDRRGPHPFLDGRVRVAFVEDPDGNPIQLVQKGRRPACEPPGHHGRP